MDKFAHECAFPRVGSVASRRGRDAVALPFDVDQGRAGASSLRRFVRLIPRLAREFVNHPRFDL